MSLPYDDNLMFNYLGEVTTHEACCACCGKNWGEHLLTSERAEYTIKPKIKKKLIIEYIKKELRSDNTDY